jgi:heparan-alpha-glucosaminide N-acetyltransferase
MSSIPSTDVDFESDPEPGNVLARRDTVRELAPIELKPELKPEPLERFDTTAPAPIPGPEPEIQHPMIPRPTERLVSLDAYRGLVMVLMVSAGLRISQVVQTFDQTPELAGHKTALWQKLAYQTDHAPWAGCTLWDLIQPSFMFMVGAALPFSLASRRAKGQPFWWMLLHAMVRSLVLVLLGVFLVSHGQGTNWTFDVVLTQIGLGYTFLFLLAWCKPSWQLAAAIAILATYWGAFALYPEPPPDLDPTKVGLPADWHRLVGFASHWDKNTNLGAQVDQWFINLFPRANGKPFEYNEGGYVTLNFVPSLATMIFGLLAGELIRSRRLTAGAKYFLLLGAGIAGLAIGWSLGFYGICPVVKRIWTPSWAIYSAGWAFAALAVFYLVIDVARLRLWPMPLVWVGMNSIAVYCMSMMLKPWVRETMRRHFGQGVYDLPFGKVYSPMVEAGFFLLFCWAVSWWLYRKKMFIKI